ncbi:uncharacterized protein LOC130725390 [Lotus japonicus]|uniref:uncharacterized protein LOC130725390 n=1 Tax=Lotus japonicus TaxID=34305 RepID=UPI002590C59B|nr:uncharacterized protein LOC130725390 [Lotus japonicus]
MGLKSGSSQPSTVSKKAPRKPKTRYPARKTYMSKAQNKELSNVPLCEDVTDEEEIDAEDSPVKSPPDVVPDDVDPKNDNSEDTNSAEPTQAPAPVQDISDDDSDDEPLVKSIPDSTAARMKRKRRVSTPEATPSPPKRSKSIPVTYKSRQASVKDKGKQKAVKTPKLHFPLSQATLVYCDNVSAIYLSGNPVQHQRTKHIEMDIHFVREKVARGQARILHVPSRHQIADIFTKGLPRVLFDDFRSGLSYYRFSGIVVFTFHTIAMNEPLETIMEVREDFMVSPAGDSEPTFRTAHFLKPIATSIDGTVSEIFSSSVPPMLETEPKEYEVVWKKVGIFEAIMSTKFKIVKNHDLLFEVAEKWCSQTNTFVFPWGEATITLEDVMVLGGYPVLGDPVFTSLQNQEMREVEQKLILARKEPWRRRKSKAYVSIWIDIFINSGSEIEHEAFLVAWLSLFVFPHQDYVNQSVFPIAILLARGNPIALAPAVLASIYKDLGLLKETIAGLTKIPVAADKLDKELEVTLESPFYLVQIWLWERFQNLQPETNVIKDGDPLLFRWHKVKGMKIDNARLALNSAMGDFLWRPYVRYGGKCRAFYPENEIQQVPFEADLDKELASFVRCMRVSELVGIDSTILQYCPHRVAMQFGMDQDVLDCVPVFRRTEGIAWENYCRPISDRNLYFPSRLFEADVTTRYARWWKQSVMHHQDFAVNIVHRKRSTMPSTCGPHVVKENISCNVADVPPVFPPKLISTVVVGKSCDDGSKTVEVDNDADVTSGFLPNHLQVVPFGNSVQDGSKANGNTAVDVPTSFPPKHDALSPCIYVKNPKPVLEEDKCCGMAQGLANVEDNTVTSLGRLKEDFEDANGNKEPMLSTDRVRLSGIQGESCVNVVELKRRIRRLERVISRLKKARFGNI